MSKKVNKRKKRRNNSNVKNNKSNSHKKSTSNKSTSPKQVNTKNTTPDTKPKPKKPEPKMVSKGGSITNQRTVVGTEKKINDLVDQNMISLPFLMPFINISDGWNRKVRQPLANFVAKRLITPPRRTNSSDIKLKKSSRFLLDFFDVLVKVILIAIIFSIFTLYTIPLMVGVAVIDHPTFIAQLVILAFMLFIWEEIGRIMRSINKYMDFYSNNMVENRRSEILNPGTYTAKGRSEGYKIGWASGVWKSYTSPFFLKRQISYFLSGLVMFGVLNLGSYVDTLLNTENTSKNVQALAQISNQVPFLMIITTICLAPMIEEYVFRGVVFRTCLLFNEQIRTRLGYEQGWQTLDPTEKIMKQRRVSLVLSTIIQACLFAFAHDAHQLGYGAGLFISAVLLQIIYYKSGTIRANIMTHAWSNALAVLIPTLIVINSAK